MRTVAGRWRLLASVAQPTPNSYAYVDFEESDFALGVERVPPSSPMVGGPTIYRVAREGIELVRVGDLRVLRS